VSRRGLSLFEVLVALTLTGVVSVLAWSILQTAAYRLRDRSERMAMEHAVRVSAVAVRALLEPLGHDSAAGSDLALVAPDGFVARATRGSGVVCAADAARLVVRSAADWWHALRVPVAGRDSIMAGTITEPSHWVVADLSGAPSPGSCPDGTEALILPAALTPADLASIGPGSPLRVFEPMELQAYSSSGAAWVGLRSVSSGGSIQPLAGPFIGAGLTLSYFASSGGTASIPGQVATAEWRINAITEREGGIGVARTPWAQTDSGGGSVRLRNAP
jgi:hypothetical protein